MHAPVPLPPVTRTACPYCGVGCGVSARPDGLGGAITTGDPDHPANFGRLCSKGFALEETLGLNGRLLHPMLRRADGSHARVDWDTALSTCRATMQNARCTSIDSLIRSCGGFEAAGATATASALAAIDAAASPARGNDGMTVRGELVEERSSRQKEAGWLFTMEFCFFMLSGVARVGAPDNYHAIYLLLE